MKLRTNILIFSLVIVLDQLTKFAARASLVEGEPVSVIPKFFNLTLVYNPGAAFGMFSSLPDTARRLALIAVSVAALFVVLWFMAKEAKGDQLAQIALSGILAGAIGNIVDRFRFDAVVDFLDVYYSSYHWPAFNIADSAISVGVTLLVLRFLFRSDSQTDMEKPGS